MLFWPSCDLCWKSKGLSHGSCTGMDDSEVIWNDQFLISYLVIIQQAVIDHHNDMTALNFVCSKLGAKQSIFCALNFLSLTWAQHSIFLWLACPEMFVMLHSVTINQSNYFLRPVNIFEASFLFCGFEWSYPECSLSWTTISLTHCRDLHSFPDINWHFSQTHGYYYTLAVAYFNLMDQLIGYRILLE